MATYHKWEKYFPYIFTPRKNGNEMVEHLQRKVRCTQADISTFPTFHLKLIVQNIMHSIIYTGQCKEEKFEFVYLLVEHNGETDYYYQEMLSDRTPVRYEPIYVLIEIKTGYITSNSTLLSLELFMEQGIEPEEVGTDSIIERNYLSMFMHYEEQYGRIYTGKS